jgi:argininosuccinate lyase
MAEAMVPLNRSLDVDIRLWPQDIRGSQAWTRALVRAGVLEEAEGDTLVEGLDRVAARLSERDHSDEADEDIHSLVERLLHEEVGEVAGKLHTGRSRNDQVGTDFRLWGMETAERLDGVLRDVEEALLDWASESVEIIFPGYTHLQQGQPVRAAHWVLSHFWPLERDRVALRAVRDQAGVLPLGSGAIAGCPFPVDREFLRAHLGFLSISENSMDAVGDRDWALGLAFATARVGIHLSRFAEDLVLFGSKEFGFVRLSDGFSTGSSLMPQKRNPDVAELVRGKSGRLTGNLVSLLTMLKGLPTGYNRDLQEDKGALFDSVDTLSMVLPAIEGAIRGAEFQTDRIEAALDPQLLATDLADYLVRAGVPFRKAHEVVATVVRVAAEQGTAVNELALETFQEAHAAFGADVFDVFEWERSVEAREAPGGTARKAVLEQIKAAALCVGPGL